MSSQKFGKHIEYNSETNIPQFVSEYSDNGEKTGIWTIYYPNGKIHITCNYKENNLDGEYKEFDQSNKLSKHGIFVNGSKHGYWIEKTSLSSESGSYCEGKRHGEWLIEKFDIIKQKTYDNGIIRTVRNICT